MAFFDSLKQQFRAVIEWQNPSADSLFEQWTEDGDEIKNASKLLIGPGQGCIFVYQGKVQSVITQPCLINLKTDNIPFWTTISKFMQFFESEHKVGLYFFKTSKILDQKWGTPSVIKYPDPHYKFPVGLKAYGNYSYTITDPEHFFCQVVGSQKTLSGSIFRNILSARIIQPLSDFLASSQISYMEIDAKREEIARTLQIKLAISFHKLGLQLSDFRIEGTDFDDETLKRVNRIADLSAEAQAAVAVGLDYSQLQRIEALRDAAKNDNGTSGAVLGMATGLDLNRDLNAVNRAISPVAQAISDSNYTDKLKQLKALYQAELISEEDYASKKKQILDQF
ncbi:MAG: SPFH domain-containing protein [Methylococcaceae bacterium]|jgi:membrane protease subunit (stomatin/prohibitin family)